MKIPYFGNYGVVGLGETFKANEKSKALLEIKYAPASADIQKVLNENLLVYKSQKLQNAYLAVMDLDDRRYFLAELNLANTPSERKCSTICIRI